MSNDEIYDTLKDCCDSNDFENFKQVLESNPDFDINYSGETGETLLYRTCCQDELEFVEHLLTIKNIDVNKPKLNLDSPLITSCYFYHIAGWDPNNYLKIIKLLLSRPEINVNYYSKHGWTALSLAERYQCQDLINLLQERLA